MENVSLSWIEIRWKVHQLSWRTIVVDRSSGETDMFLSSVFLLSILSHPHADVDVTEAHRPLTADTEVSG